jgi:hypothetical protein
MARPQIANLEDRIFDIAGHVTPAARESESPIEHYKRASNDAWNLLLYIDRNVRRANVYPTVAEKHLARFRGMVLLSLIEAFERFLKELAGVCVDHVVSYVLDNSDRLSQLHARPADLAAHFASKSLGRGLCEGDTWLDCDEINKRFRRLLAEPFEKGGFEFFPKANKADRDRIRVIETLWQLRHTLAHNLGMITRSDAAKLRLLVKANIDAPTVLSPKGADLWYVKNYLDGITEWSNGRVATALTDLLTELHKNDPTLFDPQARADELVKQVGVAVAIAGKTASP